MLPPWLIPSYPHVFWKWSWEEVLAVNSQIRAELQDSSAPHTPDRPSLASRFRGRPTNPLAQPQGNSCQLPRKVYTFLHSLKGQISRGSLGTGGTSNLEGTSCDWVHETLEESWDDLSLRKGFYPEISIWILTETQGGTPSLKTTTTTTTIKSS